MADSADTIIAPAIPRATPDKGSDHRPLVRDEVSYDRSAIMAHAWALFRFQFDKPGTRSHRPFGHFLAAAWRVARNVRARMADGSIEREQAEIAARETLRQQLEASLTQDQREAQWAWIMRQCSTDGRLPESRNW